MYHSITQAQTHPSTYTQRATLNEMKTDSATQSWFGCLQHQPIRA